MQRYIAIFFLILTSVLSVMAQSEAYSQERDSIKKQEVRLPYPQIFSDMKNVKVVQDTSITMMMQDKRYGRENEVIETSGFRVQVFSSNTPVQAKAEALQMEEYIKDAISQPVYVISSPPFIKVRIGDFRTQEEAKRYKDEFIEQFPDLMGETYVVRDEHIYVRAQ